MLIQTALIYSATIIIIFAFFAALLIKEPVGARRAKPFYLAFYFFSLALIFWAEKIPDFDSDLDIVILDCILGLFVSSLTIGISIRYERPMFERIAYALLIVYVISVLLLQIYSELNQAISFYFMLINAILNIIAVLKRKPHPNRADYGLVATFTMWMGMVVFDITSPDAIDPQSYFLSDVMLYQLMFFPANIFGVTVFLLASYLMDSNVLLEKLATKDELTDMLNRRALFDQISAQINYLKRKNSNAAIIIADIDYFKKVNDTYGHEAGDKVIKQFAATVHASVRGYDIAARYGGEEFLIFLPNADLAIARTVAERMRKETEQSELLYNGINISFTASFGLANHKLSDDLDVSIAYADQALYQAKRSGRNQVVEFTGE